MIHAEIHWKRNPHHEGNCISAQADSAFMEVVPLGVDGREWIHVIIEMGPDGRLIPFWLSEAHRVEVWVE